MDNNSDYWYIKFSPSDGTFWVALFPRFLLNMWEKTEGDLGVLTITGEADVIKVYLTLSDNAMKHRDEDISKYYQLKVLPTDATSTVQQANKTIVDLTFTWDMHKEKNFRMYNDLLYIPFENLHI